MGPESSSEWVIVTVGCLPSDPSENKDSTLTLHSFVLFFLLFVLCVFVFFPRCDVELHSPPIRSVYAQEQTAGCRCVITCNDTLTEIMSPHGDVSVQSVPHITQRLRNSHELLCQSRACFTRWRESIKSQICLNFFSNSILFFMNCFVSSFSSVNKMIMFYMVTLCTKDSVRQIWFFWISTRLETKFWVLISSISFFSCSVFGQHHEPMNPTWDCSRERVQ